MIKNTIKELILKRELPHVDGYRIYFRAEFTPAVEGEHLGIAHVKITAEDGDPKHTLSVEKNSTIQFYNSITEEYIENLWKGIAMKLYIRSRPRY